MDRNLDVFVSSAIGEFANERKALKTALERWQFVRAWAFEEATAYAEPRDAGYLRRAAECDIFILLVGDNYRQPVEDEFATALNAHRSILAFVKHSSKMQADAMFAKYQASDKFKYAIFDNSQQLEAQVIEAVTEDIVRRVRLSSQQALQLVTAQPQPQLSPTEREQLDQEYIAEVTRRYEFWREHYTPLAAIAQLQSRSTTPLSVTPSEFLPRGFDVLLREKFSRESDEHDPKAEHYDDLRDAIEKHGDLFLLGDPGAGKTTTLWRLMFDYAQRAQSDQRTTKPAHLPILISLGRYEGTAPILDFLRTELVLQSKTDSTDTPYPAHRRLAVHLDEYLADGRLMLLFDALNEMPQAHYSGSIRRLEQFRDAQRGNRFVFTCRALDYTTKLDVPEATIQELDENTQLDFLTAYFADAGAQLFGTLRYDHKDLLDIGRNPYMLLMIGQVYQLQGELPPNRGLLFQSFVNALMERERKTHPDHWLSTETQIRVLSDFAFAIQREHGRGTSVPREWADRFLTGSVRVNGRGVAYNPSDLLYLARSASLLDESADGSLRFTHQLLQEYFAAVALLQLGMNDPQVREALRYYSWDEVLVLMAGLMDDATPIVEIVMAVDPFLAARCVKGASTVSPDAIKALIAILKGKLNSHFHKERVGAVVAIGALKLEVAMPHLILLLGDKDFSIRSSVIEILAAYRSEMLVPYLLPLLKDDQSGVRFSAFVALAELESEKLVPYFVPLLREHDDGIRYLAADVLGEFGTETLISYLIPLLKDEDSSVRWGALDELTYLEVESSIPHIIPLLDDESRAVRESAVFALGKLRCETRIPYLLELLKGEDSDMRHLSAEALAWFGPEICFPHIIPLLKDNDKLLRRAGAEALEFLRSEETLTHLVPLLRDEEDVVRLAAVRALGTLESEEIMPYLIPLLSDEVGSVRRAAVVALGRLKSEALIPFLAPLLEDKDSSVRKAAVTALDTFKSAALIPSLVLLLADESPAVRMVTVVALRAIGSESIIPYLIPLLKDVDGDVRWRVVYTLGGFRSAELALNLVPSLKDEYRRVREEAVEALGLLGSDFAVPHIVSLLSEGTGARAETVLKATLGERHLPLLVPLLSDADANIRNTAYEIIEAVKRRLNLPKDYVIESEIQRDGNGKQQTV